MFLFAASAMDRANAGAKDAESCLRILTPLLKFRACRDNIPVATGAMEVRGGNGYIEEWVNARLVRDAHIGVLWEGTSNINALDIITRAVGKSRAHRTLGAALAKLLDEATRDTGGVPRSPAPGAGAHACLRRARRGRARAGGDRAAGRQRALSRHQRHPDDVGSSPAERRRAPRLVCAACPRTSPERAGSACARDRRLGTAKPRRSCFRSVRFRSAKLSGCLATRVCPVLMVTSIARRPRCASRLPRER